MRYSLFIAALLMACSVPATAASFDCTKAKTKAEKAICSDKELSLLDEDLAKVYKSALKQHPAKGYVLARQRDWLSLNKYCDPAGFVRCLKKNYKKRIAQLSDIENLQVYTNTDNFSYEDGDAVAEIRKIGAKYMIEVWGGFRIHPHASRENGRATFTGCEFEGFFSSPSGGVANSLEYADFKFTFKIEGNRLSYNDSRQICSGFGDLPEFLQQVDHRKGH